MVRSHIHPAASRGRWPPRTVAYPPEGGGFDPAVRGGSVDWSVRVTDGEENAARDLGSLVVPAAGTLVETGDL